MIYTYHTNPDRVKGVPDRPKPVVKKVFQTVFDGVKGNCWQAAWATLLGLELSDVPNFIEYEDYNGKLGDFLKGFGYEYDSYIINPNRKDLTEEQMSMYLTFEKELPESLSINSLFDAVVWSPNLPGQCHAVVIDKYFNIVHDPHPKYQDNNYPLKDEIGYNGIIEVQLFRNNNYHSECVEYLFPEGMGLDKAEGERVEEGKDFEIKKMWSNGMVWYPADDEMYDKMQGDRRIAIALPVKSNDMKDNWTKASDKLPDYSWRVNWRDTDTKQRISSQAARSAISSGQKEMIEWLDESESQPGEGKEAQGEGGDIAKEYATGMVGMGEYDEKKWDYADKVLFNTIVKAVNYGLAASKEYSREDWEIVATAFSGTDPIEAIKILSESYYLIKKP